MATAFVLSGGRSPGVVHYLRGLGHALRLGDANVWDMVDDPKAIVASGPVVAARRLADPAVALTDLATR